MMKRFFLFFVAIIMLVSLTVAAFADTSAPGSSEDPVVTQSYVDGRTQYSAIQLTAGQKLVGGEGCEIILRSGEASAIDNGLNGISDITAGADLMSGNPVGLNHLILVPRADGRGITAITDIWVMVRGSYTVQ